jgi:ubiquinone/menaquinone biosynthesis C-methylase UbiE
MTAAVFDRADAAYEPYQAARTRHWDTVARQLDRWTGLGGAYHRRLAEVYRFLVPPGRKVLEIGCGRGDLLAALEPSLGVGVDLSSEMIARASRRHPGLRFIHADAHDLDLQETFDVIILSDLLNDVWDVQAVFEQIAPLTTPRTRVIINSYSRLWELPLMLAGSRGRGRRAPPPNNVKNQ